MKRVPWTLEEDEFIRTTWNGANGSFPTYAEQAAKINREFHGGKKVRSPSAVCRREGVVVWGKKTNQPSKL